VHPTEGRWSRRSPFPNSPKNGRETNNMGVPMFFTTVQTSYSTVHDTGWEGNSGRGVTIAATRPMIQDTAKLYTATYIQRKFKARQVNTPVQYYR